MTPINDKQSYYKHMPAVHITAKRAVRGWKFWDNFIS